jgi:hypothetical protein
MIFDKYFEQNFNYLLNQSQCYTYIPLPAYQSSRRRATLRRQGLINYIFTNFT